MDVLPHQTFQRRYQGQRGVVLGLGPLGVELGADAGLLTNQRQIPGGFLVVGVASVHRQLVLMPAQFEIIAGHLGDDA